MISGRGPGDVHRALRAVLLTGNAVPAHHDVLLRDWVARKIAASPRMRAIENAVQHHDWKLVFLTRLSPVMPFSLTNYALGVTGISAWRFLIATELGAVPATLVYVCLGTLIGNRARSTRAIANRQQILYHLFLQAPQAI